MILSRRQFLASSAVALGAAALPTRLFAQSNQTAFALPASLSVESRTLDVLGKAAKVYAIRRPDGGQGIVAQAGQRFSVRLDNRLDEATALHWHGQTPPNAMDGVPGLTQQPIAAGASFDYDFALRPGTHWMHSHHGLQEQRLMAAPMVVVEDPAADEQNVIVLLHDFSFTAPEEQLSKLTGMAPVDHAQMHHGGQIPANSGMPMMDETAMHQMHTMSQSGGMPGMSHDHSHMMMGGAMSHANDLDYDAYLANDRTLADPQVTQVEAGGRVRLRIINGATTTAFQIELPGLLGQAVTVDGAPVKPLPGSSFPLAMGQRIDILVEIPKQGGAWPVLARREDAHEQTGIILATKGAAVKKLALKANGKGALMSLDFERRLTAATPLAERTADRRHLLSLEGSMMGYRWSLNGKSFGEHTPIEVKQGERVELTFMNHSDMMHPMHLHGHAFQVVGIGGQRLAGAVRDTVIVPSMSSVTVALDADNPGEWVVHCHNLFHMAAGMMTTLKYV